MTKGTKVTKRQASLMMRRMNRQVVSAVAERLEELGITRMELARRMDVRPNRISLLLTSDEPVTLRTVARMLDAVGLTATIKIEEAKK